MKRIVGVLIAWLLIASGVTQAATSITTRSGAGRSLTWSEMDTNFSNLRNATDGYAASLGSALASLVQSQTAGTIGFQTVAAMNADLAHPANTIALVTNDTTTTNNTYWIKLGASGSGSWQKSGIPSGIPFVHASLYADFATAVAAQGALPATLVVSASMAVASNLSVPSTCTVWILPSGSLNPATGVTLTINGTLSAGLYQVIGGAGSVVINSGQKVHPEWFANSSVWSAIQALPSTGGTIELQNKVYAPLGNSITKDGVAIVGVKKPAFNSGFTGLTGGSIIQGPLLFQANNLQFKNLGVDSGSAVCTSLYAGVAQQGLVCTVLNYTGTILSGLIAEDIVTIAQSPTAAVHAFAVEGYDNAVIRNIETVYGVHGQAYKVRYSQLSDLRSMGNANEGIIFKSQGSPTRYFNNNSVKGVFVSAKTPGDTAAGVRIEAHDTIPISNNQFYGIETTGVGVGIGVYPWAAGDVISDLTFNGFNVTSSTSNGIEVLYDSRRIKFIGGSTSGNAAYGVAIGSGASFVSFTDVTANNNTYGFVNAAVDTDFVACVAQNNSSYGFFALTGSSTFKTACRGSGNTGGLFGADAGVIYGSRLSPAAFIAPTLAGSWVNYDSTFNTQAGYYQDDSGNIWLRGLVKSGSGLIFTLPAGYRPPKYLRFPVSTLSGATLTLGEVTIGSAGDVSLGAGGNTYVSLDGIVFRPM